MLPVGVKYIVHTFRSHKHGFESYIIKFSLSVCLSVSMFVRNRLPNYVYFGDEAFAGDSVGLGLGQRTKFYLKKNLF